MKTTLFSLFILLASFVYAQEHECTIILVRHGETNLNAKQVFQGELPSFLTEKGKKQA